MPSTHLSLYYHLVFSTKNRVPFIDTEWRARLYAYMGGIVRAIHGTALAIGGINDHVHLLVGLRAIHRLDYVVRDVKSESSGWIHSEIGVRKFEWQAGYLGVTVSPSHIERVRRYILNQERHHRRRSFQEEYLELLQRSAIEYDERYVF
jgi:REP element-mobilizing transposase RayT